MLLDKELLFRFFFCLLIFITCLSRPGHTSSGSQLLMHRSKRKSGKGKISFKFYWVFAPEKNEDSPR